MQRESTLVQILPVVLIVFLCFIGIGATTSVIPVYVNTELGLSSATVGVVIGECFIPGAGVIN